METTENKETQIVETTIGELISTIQDTVADRYCDKEEINSITKLVLENLRLRYEV